MTAVQCYPERSPQVDKLSQTLSHNFRREVIDYFENHTDDDSVFLSEVIDYISSRVNGYDREGIEKALRHHHLPLLNERGWLDYDDREGVIRYYGKRSAGELLSAMVRVFNS